MPTRDRRQIVRECFAAYESGDRRALDEALSDDLTFFSPADVGIDRDTYFERCWPNAGQIADFEFTRLVEIGDEVLTTYECTRVDGTRFRNTEIHSFVGDRISRVEVYFGWNLD